MAPKRKASAAAKENKKENAKTSKENEASKEKEAAAAAAPSAVKKSKQEPVGSPVRTRGRPSKAPALAQPEEPAKVKEANAKECKPARGSKAKVSKAEQSQPAVDVAEPVRKAESKYSKHVIIEHCKQCNSFKTRALKVKESLEARVQGVKVSVNLEKPRKGCFEVRDEQGQIFVSLLDMPRPFKKMKDLNLDATIDDIVEKLNGT